MSAELIFLIPLIWAALAGDEDRSTRFTFVFPSLERLTELFNIMDFKFCDGLLNVLQAPLPPPIQWFESLDAEHGIHDWAIYAMVLKKTGCSASDKLYIGSATASRRAVETRWYDYSRIYDTTPWNVVHAFKEGYTITSKVLLATCPLPAAGDVPTHRTVVLALEACFACCFWAMFYRDIGDRYYGFKQARIWPVDAFTYEGLCSHSPLREGHRGEVDIPKELLEKEAVRIHRKAIVYGKAYHDRQRLQKTEKFKAQQAGWNKRQRPRTQQLRHEAVAAKKFYCATCDYAGGDKDKLNQHEKTKRHKLRVKKAEMRDKAVAAAAPAPTEAHSTAHSTTQFTTHSVIHSALQSTTHVTVIMEETTAELKVL